MAGIVRLNAEGLQHSSSQLKNQGQEFEALIQQMENVIGSLSESWEGNSAEAYRAQFEELKPGLTATRELIETIAVQIDDTLVAMQELDDRIAGQLGK